MKRLSCGSLLSAMFISSCFLASLPMAVQAQEKPAAKEAEITYPTPDLTIVKKYFKVVKYAYDDVKEQLVMTVVPLSDSVPALFKVVHYDAAGERIDFDLTLHYYNAVLGEQKTCKVAFPKRYMDRAKKAVISRP